MSGDAKSGLLQLRRAHADDARLLADIHCRARAAAMPWLPVLHTLDETRSWMETVVLTQQEVWLAVRDGEAAGFVALAPGWVEQLYIDPPAWRLGAGSWLLDHAKRRQAKGFQLWTFQRNEMARIFYSRHGLVEVRLTDGRDNEEKQPDVLLAWIPAA